MATEYETNNVTPRSRFQTLSTSLPFLFTLAALLFFVSFLISSFPLGRNPLKSDPIKRVYFADHINSGHREIIRKFNSLHEGDIEVVPVDLPFTKFNTNQRKELIARNLRSRGSRIDVFSVDLIWVPRFTKWAEPLAPYFSPQSLSGMIDQSLNTCFVDGMLYSIPLYTDIGALYYREDMILNLPDGEAINERIKASIEWSELLEIGQKYFPNRPVYIPQAAAYEGLICNYNEILGRSLQDPDTGELVDLTTPWVVERTRFFQDLFLTGIAPPAALNLTEDECIRYALQYDIPFVRGWPTVNNEDDPRFDPAKFEKLAIAPLPHFDGASPTPVFGGWNMMLSHHSPVKEAAILFMQYAASDEGQQIFYESDGLLPIQKAFYTLRDSTQRQQRLHKIEAMMETGIHRPALNQYTLISDILSSKLHEILTSQVDVLAGLTDAQNSIERIMTPKAER